MRWRPAPCEKVMLRRASVDQRFTGTDSSMKLSRRSDSEPFCRAVAGGVGPGGRGLSLLNARLRRLPSGLSGRVTSKEGVNLHFSFSPIGPTRNDFPA